MVEISCKKYRINAAAHIYAYMNWGITIELHTLVYSQLFWDYAMRYAMRTSDTPEILKSSIFAIKFSNWAIKD